jgi:hypothetical protein
MSISLCEKNRCAQRRYFPSGRGIDKRFFRPAAERLMCLFNLKEIPAAIHHTGDGVRADHEAVIRSKARKPWFFQGIYSIKVEADQRPGEGQAYFVYYILFTFAANLDRQFYIRERS